MNIQEMLAKMDAKMLRDGLLQMSKGLTQEQLKEAEKVLKGTGRIDGLGGADMETIKKELQNNPDMIKKLASDPNLVAKLREIIKK